MKRHATIKRYLLLAVLPWVFPAMSGADEEQWVTDEWFEVSGDVVGIHREHPSGELVLQNAERRWTVRLGAPWRNTRAGLTEDRIAVGQNISVYGYPSKSEDKYLVKALRVVVDGRNYDLYPGQIR